MNSISGMESRQGLFDVYVHFVKYALLRKYYSLRLRSTAFCLKSKVFRLRVQDSYVRGNDRGISDWIPFFNGMEWTLNQGKVGLV
jgi:hypothetical protein